MKNLFSSKYWIPFLGFLLAGSTSQAANGPMLHASQDPQLNEVRQGVQQGSLESKRIQKELIGEWFYEPILTHTNLGFLWRSIKVESGGSVSVNYQLDASKESVTKTGRLEFIHKGTDHAFPGKRPAFLIQINEGGKEEVMGFTDATVDYDSRVPQQKGMVLKFRDLAGREFLFLRKH